MRKAKEAGGPEEKSEGEMELPTVARFDMFLRHFLSSLREDFSKICSEIRAFFIWTKGLYRLVPAIIQL